MMDDLPKLLTENQVCEYLGIKIHTLRYWRRKGYISFIKIERHVRFREDDVISLLEARTQRVG